MTDFSPAAQAVYDAWITPARFPPPVSPSYAQKALAAALRAAADQVVPELNRKPRGHYDEGWCMAFEQTREQLLAIALELGTAR